MAAAPLIVIGSGAAGMACALALAPHPVTLITKTETLGGGSTPWAQGGIAAAVGADDDPALHAADTVAAGAGLVDDAVATLLAGAGAAAIGRLIAEGMPFDRAADGTLARAREAAHGRARVVHAGGDSTGRVLAETLAARVAGTPSITVLTETMAVDLAVEAGRLRGVLVFSAAEGWRVLPAAAVVLAAGGIGMAWRETTNPAENTGDGLGMAARAGALLADLEFMQFHPTALAATAAATEDGAGARLPLLTEALRGAGARLVTAAGHPFMDDEHPLAELAPRDVVARAVGRRVAAGEPVFLDLRPALAAEGADHFPQVLDLCRTHGFDPHAGPLPVVPAAHYHMGGVVTDPRGRTTLSGLWACGEVACTGVHGANRLASNSLLEALVFGRRVAGDIAEEIAAGRLPPPESGGCAVPVPGVRAATAAASLRAALRGVMSRHVGLLRDGDGLRTAAEALDDLAAALETAAVVPATATAVRAWAETRNLLTVTRLVVAAAALRRESRGAHCRADYPRSEEAFRRRITLRLGAPPMMAEVTPLAAPPAFPRETLQPGRLR
jgi:L-aspartate oxidase